jgi:hypothetical protein
MSAHIKVIGVSWCNCHLTLKLPPDIFRITCGQEDLAAAQKAADRLREVGFMAVAVEGPCDQREQDQWGDQYAA